jgi:hypothetical protein
VEEIRGDVPGVGLGGLSLGKHQLQLAIRREIHTQELEQFIRHP